MKKILVLIVLLCLLALFGFSKDSSKKKFQLEVISGLSTLNPEDLNANAKVHKQIVKFWYEDRYDYYEKVEYIQSYVTKKEGKFRTIKTALPLGFRFKYFVFQPLALSLGFKYFVRRAKSDFSLTTTISENDGTQTIYSREYSPFTISAEAFIPSLGIHFEKMLLKGIGLEIYVCAGPLFGQCTYGYDLRSESKANGNVTGTSSYYLEEEGSETGISLDGGIRLNYTISKHLGLFVGGGYAYQRVDGLEGPGRNNSNGEIEEWEGEWGMKEYYAAEYWGVIDSITASNHWEWPENYLWVRKFKLDLSGFQIRFGLAYWF